CTSAVLPRIEERPTRSMCEWARGLRGRDAAEDGDLARPASPSRCTLPITALRVMPPSSAAIWLADNPSAHSFFSVSTRSSVQVMPQILASRQGAASRQNPTAGLGNAQLARRIPALPIYASDCPPHEMSYSTMEKLQYGGSQAQESEHPASTSSVRVRPMRPHLSARLCIARTRLIVSPSCPRIAVFQRVSPAMTVVIQIRFHRRVAERRARLVLTQGTPPQ